MLQKLIAALIKEYGSVRVSHEVSRQTRVITVDMVASFMPASNPMIARAQALRKLDTHCRLKEAVEWVRANFADRGTGDPS